MAFSSLQNVKEVFEIHYVPGYVPGLTHFIEFSIVSYRFIIKAQQVNLKFFNSHNKDELKYFYRLLALVVLVF